MTRQTFIPGTEPPEEPNIPEVVERIDAWIEAKREQARAAETTKIRLQSVLASLDEHGIERHPYIDEQTGKKRYVVADRAPRLKTVDAAKLAGSEEDDDAGDAGDVGEEVVADDVSGDPGAADYRSEVEHRRVSRASVEREIDPFGHVRAAVDGFCESIPAGATVTVTSGDRAVSFKGKGRKR